MGRGMVLISTYVELCVNFRIKDALGSIDGLVNIAGGFRWEKVADGSVDTWDLLYRMNVRTTLIASRAALSLFPVGGGSIVNIGAAAAQKVGLGMGAYAASKAGVARLTESLAELAPEFRSLLRFGRRQAPRSTRHY